MTVTVSVPDQLAQEAAARGLSVETFVEQLAERAAQTSPEPNWTRLGPGPLTPEEAGRDLREARKGVTLGGLRSKTSYMRATNTNAGVCAGCLRLAPLVF